MSYNWRIVSASALGIGLYSMAEAARLLKTPRRTISRWVEGYVEPLRSGTKEYAPIIARGEESALTFGDLVELMYVKGFRDAEVPLDLLRQVAAKYRAEWATPYPFATKKFILNTRQLLLQEGDVWKHALTGQQAAFVNELTRQLVQVDDLTREWRPLGSERAVVVNPDRSFGKPIEDTSGAHTFVLALAVKNGAEEKEVAWWYGTTTQAVSDSTEFESSWAA